MSNCLLIGPRIQLNNMICYIKTFTNFALDHSRLIRIFFLNKTPPCDVQNKNIVDIIIFRQNKRIIGYKIRNNKSADFDAKIKK